MNDSHEIHYVMDSKGNLGGGTSWVQARIARVEDPDDDDADGTIFYRMNHDGGDVALEFRIYAGLKRGDDGPANKRWASIKGKVRERLYEALKGSDLLDVHSEIEVPRKHFSDSYNFNRQSKETSMFRIWLRHDEHAVPAGKVADVFPELHASTLEVLRHVDELEQRVTEWELDAAAR